jgi:hypothetical protein
LQTAWPHSTAAATAAQNSCPRKQTHSDTYTAAHSDNYPRPTAGNTQQTCSRHHLILQLHTHPPALCSLQHSRGTYTCMPTTTHTRHRFTGCW